MKKILSYIISLAVSLLAVMSCQKQPTEDKSSIKISAEKICFESGEGQSIAVGVECEGEWEIQDYTEGMKIWLEPDALKGKGNATVNFKTIEFNPYDKKRMAVLKFVSGKASSLLTITQISDPERTINLSEDLLEFGGELGTKTLEVLTAKNWEIDTCVTPIPSWLAVSAKSGQGRQNVSVSTVEVNEEIDPRSCVLDFRIDREHVASLAVIQAPGIEMSISTDSLDFNAAGSQTKQLDVFCNSTTKQWTIEGYNTQVMEWLSLDITSGVGNKTLTFKTLGKNEDLTKIAHMTVRLDAKRYLNFTVSQASGLEISVAPAKIDFGGNEAESQTAVVTTNTSKYEWAIEGYTEDVQSWLEIDVVRAKALSKAITIKTLGPNTSGNVRKAELVVKLSEGVEAKLIVSQDKKKAGLKIISWTGNKDTQTITAPSGKDYNYFLYTTDTDPSKNPVWTDGPGGKTEFTGYFKTTRDYVFAMDTTATMGSSYTLELGPSTDETKCFYGNMQVHGYVGYRTRNAYIKIPAITGYKLTGAKVLCGNAADKAKSVTFSTDKSITSGTATTAANVLEGKAQLTLGKPTPVDVSFTTTQAGVEYYLFIVQDRLITGFTLTYTEVQ